MKRILLLLLIGVLAMTGIGVLADVDKGADAQSTLAIDTATLSSFTQTTATDLQVAGIGVLANIPDYGIQINAQAKTIGLDADNVGIADNMWMKKQAYGINEVDPLGIWMDGYTKFTVETPAEKVYGNESDTANTYTASGIDVMDGQGTWLETMRILARRDSNSTFDFYSSTGAA